jgi:hypothetical protein
VTMKGRTKKLPKKKLPKKFRGADVVRGLGLGQRAFEDLIRKRSLDNFDAMRETFLVVEDRALEDDFGVEVRCFADEALAIRCARALANGNVDQRVLKITQQTLVVGTENDL